MFEQLVKTDQSSPLLASKPRAPRGQTSTLLLAFIRKFFEENDQIPPCHVISEHFGFASNNAAYDHMAVLCKRGFIERNAVGKWRFVRKTPSEAAQ